MLIEGTNFDNIIHLITALAAFALFVVSFHSYLRIKRERFFYICCAFFVYSIKEFIVVADITFYRNSFLTGLSHSLNLLILLLFFIGVVKK